MNKAKSFNIPKAEVWEAYKRVRSKKGAAGVDGQSIDDFEGDKSNTLYKLWNRMSSGSYFPQPVLRVDIPKATGGTRPLGIPTVTDRIAQTVVKRYLEPIVEDIFHEDSYGYRPEKSAIQAVGKARQRCWRNDWVLDLDIKGFFDNIDHDLLMRAVRKHTSCTWVLLYIERWLKTPVQLKDGTLEERSLGTPQGSVISPILANLFLHYAFDNWMARNHPDIPFERYADDGVCHCKRLAQAKHLKVALEQRMAECKLELHPEKTKIVYCKDNKRRGRYPQQSFDFLGYTFRPRKTKNKKGQFFLNFSPAISNNSAKAMRQKMRKWALHLRSDKSLDDLAGRFNPILRGWIGYYGHFYKSAMYPTFQHFDRILAKWARRKFKRFKRHKRQSARWVAATAARQPSLFVHWKLLKGA